MDNLDIEQIKIDCKNKGVYDVYYGKTYEDDYFLIVNGYKIRLGDKNSTYAKTKAEIKQYAKYLSQELNIPIKSDWNK